MANNRGQAHIKNLQSRTELQEYTVERIYENDNEEIDAVDVTASILAIAQSSVNLVDDDVDLRQGKTESFIFSQCTQNGVFYEYTLAHEAINPHDGSTYFIIEGLAMNYVTDFEINADKLTFSANEDFLPDTKMSIRYKYYDTKGN